MKISITRDGSMYIEIGDWEFYSVTKYNCFHVATSRGAFGIDRYGQWWGGVWKA